VYKSYIIKELHHIMPT